MKNNLFLKVVVCTFFVIWIVAFILFNKITATWFHCNILFITIAVDIGVALGLFGFSFSQFFHENRDFIITSNKIPAIFCIGFVLCMGAGILYREAACKDYLLTQTVNKISTINDDDTAPTKLDTTINKKVSRRYNNDYSSDNYTSRTIITSSSSSRSDSDDYDYDDDSGGGGGGIIILILIIVVILLFIGSLFISHFWVLAGSLWILLLIFLLYWKQKYAAME